MALVDELISMQKSMSDDDIIRNLVEKGYTPLEISDAFNQAKLKQSFGGKESLMPSIMQQEISTPAPMPAPQLQPQQEAAAYYPYAYPTQPQVQQPKQNIDMETIEEIAEEIINEKWQEFKSKVGDIGEWKLYTEGKIKGLDDRLKRLESSIDKLQAALLGKVTEYSQNIKDVGAEVQSLEMAFSKVLEPLISNIKELSKLTDELKKARPAKGKK